MELISVTKKISNAKAILSAEINSASFKEKKTIFFSYPERFYDFLPVSADPFFPALLIPSMMSGENLIIHTALSENIMQNQAVIQEVFKTWYPEKLNIIEVEPKSVNGFNNIQNGKNATFFSLGVDSMYTMLKYLPANNPPKDKRLNYLLYMKGLELPLSHYSQGQDKLVIQKVENLASHYGLDVIVGETNIRDVFSVDFETLYTGPCLASIALSLSAGLKNIFIPSHYSYTSLFPVASSPLIDHLWSNEDTSIIHDGSEKDRAEKVTDQIVNDSFALDNLRVCVSNDGGDFNCGKCWKCIRTMITLDIVGKLGESAAFPDSLPKTYCKELKTWDYSSMVFVKENLKLARKYKKKKLERILKNEIRIGKFDQIREGLPIYFILREMIFYYMVKTGRKLKILGF